MWHIWPRDCREKMEKFLRRHAQDFANEGCSVEPNDILHPIHDQVSSWLPPRRGSAKAVLRQFLC